MRSLLSAFMRQRGATVAVRLIRRYRFHDVGQQGAALAYYLLFSLFPILILISSLIGQVELDISGILDTLAPILPTDVLTLAETYLRYVAEHVSISMLWFCAIFSIWFPTRATGCLMRAVRRAYDLGLPKHRMLYAFKVLFFTVLLLLCLVLTLLLVTLSSRITEALGGIFSLPKSFPRIWGILRFAALGAVIFALLFALYAAAQDKRCPLRAIVPGAALSTFAWLVLSTGYAFYAENISNYSAIYGALGTVVILLIWLYLSSMTLIMGAEFNHILLHTPTRRDGRFDQGDTL